MENFILKRLWLDRDQKARQDWEWVEDIQIVKYEFNKIRK